MTGRMRCSLEPDTRERRGLPLAICLLGLLASAASNPAHGDERVRFRSWTELWTENVVLQRLDFSCGAAAVATLATFFLGRKTSEQAALGIIRSRYSPMEWRSKRKDGLSMDDLVFMAESLGFKAEGGRIGLAGLMKVKGPVIVHLDKGEFQHFTVLRGIHGMTVYLADPITGTTPMPMGSFLEQFTGAVLAVWDQKSPLPSDHVLKLHDRDAFYDNAYDAVRPTFYDQGPRSIRPVF